MKTLTVHERASGNIGCNTESIWIRIKFAQFLVQNPPPPPKTKFHSDVLKGSQIQKTENHLADSVQTSFCQSENNNLK
jgi:hypothetical protein